MVEAPLGTRPKGSEAGACDSNECSEWPTSSALCAKKKSLFLSVVIGVNQWLNLFFQD